jgi:hypothetical protein
MMTKPSLLWQMSPEESTKDAKKWKSRFLYFCFC